MLINPFRPLGTFYARRHIVLSFYRSCRWKRCSKCQVLINPEEPSFTVMDAVFHNSCMTCANCCKPITKDDSFGVDRKHVYCSAHFKTAEPVLPSFGGRAAWNQCMELDPGKPEELRNWTENTYPVLSNLVHGERRATETRNTTCWRSCPAKRVRTAFSSDQLDVLNSFFKAGRKPTVKQLEELSGVTGLKVNVLKVSRFVDVVLLRDHLLHQLAPRGNPTPEYQVQCRPVT